MNLVDESSQSLMENQVFEVRLPKITTKSDVGPFCTKPQI